MDEAAVPGRPLPAVRLTRLNLTDFRNYAQLTLPLSGRHVVLTGENGAGKTNLLEAVSFLSPGRGLRRAAYDDVARQGAGQGGGFTVFAALEGMAGPVEIGTGTSGGADETSGRRIRIGGAPAKNAEELLDHVRILWLTPAMDGLFTGPAGDRRRFLDRLVLSINPAHGRRALDYEKAMRMRNRLLADRPDQAAWLAVVEREMAELGIALAAARAELVALMKRQVAAAPAETPFPTAEIALEGFLDEAEPSTPAVDLEERFFARLRDGRDRDRAAGRTLEGPHRADLMIRHRQKDMPAALCSTGEQKALLVGLVLGHARLVGELSGYPPVLLLDEIAAHLDEHRRAALFHLIDDLGSQAFMTGTDHILFSSLGDRAQSFVVSDGAVRVV